MHQPSRSNGNKSRIFSDISHRHQNKDSHHFLRIIRANIFRTGLLITGFLLFSATLYAQNFEGQIVQVCDGVNATKIFVTANGSSSGNWIVYNLSTNSPVVTGSDFDYLAAGGLSVGNQLEIRDAGSSSEKATLINNGGGTTFFILNDGGTSTITSCDYERVCPTASLFDLTGRDEANEFSNSNKNGIIGSDELNGTHNGNFNAVIFGNFTSTDGSGDTEGRLAVQNNFTASDGYTVGAGYPGPGGTGGWNAPFGWDNLIVGGNMDYPVSGGVRGNVLYNNNTGSSLPGIMSIGSGSSSGMYRNFSPDVDWAGSQNAMQDLSESLSPSNISLPHSTGEVDISGSTVTLDGLNQTGLVVFNVDPPGASLSFNFININNANAIVINISGSGFTLTGGSISLEGSVLSFPFQSGNPGKELIEKTLWNFYETTIFSLSGYMLTGSVLAPFTTSVTLSGGNINGQSVFSGNVNQNNGFEFHNFCFTSSDYLPEEFTLTLGPCWRTLSSPIQDLQYNELLDDLWTQGMPGADYTEGEANIFVMNPTGNDWTPLANLDQEITPGTGFLISVFTDDEYGTPGNWDKTITVGGTEHSAPVTVTNTDMATDGFGFTLLGNPYKRSIRFDGLNHTDVDDAIWVYNRNASGTTDGSQGSWVSWSGGVGDLTDGIIAPFQGFLVRNSEFPSGSGPSVTFPESSKTTGGEFYGKQKQPLHFIRMEVQGESLYNSMWIRFSADGSFGNTQGDAIQLMPFENNYATLSTRKNNGDLMDIGHFPIPGQDEEYSIPLQANITKTGTYTISATDLNIPSGLNFVLHDLKTGVNTPITKNFKYSFSVRDVEQQKVANTPIASCTDLPQQAKSNEENRFLITSNFQENSDELPSKISLEQNYPNPFNPTTQISYQLPQQNEVLLEVYDLTGKLITTLVNETVSSGTHSVTFNAANLSSGVYMYRLQTMNQVLSRKLTVIK